MGKTVTLMTDEERDNVLLLLDKGLSPAQVGSILSRSASVVRQIQRVYEAVKAGDIEGAKKRAMTSNNTALFFWACRKHGVDPSPPKEPERPAPDEPDTAHRGNDPTTLNDLEDAIHVASKKDDARMDDLLKKLDQLATIIQSCAADVRNAINANADIQMAELKRQSDLLGGIKMNTKKTIWKGSAE